jgi:hypothetical protein
VHGAELTADTLLCDDEIRLQSNDSIAHGLDLLFLNLQYPVPVLLFADLNVGLTLALLVLERAVQQQNAGVFNSPPHLRMCDVLVEHDPIEHLAVLDFTSGNLLNTGVALDVDLLLSSADLQRDCAHSFQGKTAH